jgi:hypothetical protein
MPRAMTCLWILANQISTWLSPRRVGGREMNADLRVIGQKVVNEFGFIDREIIAVKWISRPGGWEATT